MPDAELNRRHSLSLERALPLALAAVLAVALAISAGVTYATLRRAAVVTAQERLARAVAQLSNLAETGVRAARVRYLRVAADTAIVDALTRARADNRLTTVSTPGVKAALTRLVMPNDSGMPIELWTADERRIAAIGDTEPRAPQLDEQRSPVLREVDALTASDTIRLGHLYASGGRSLYWLVAPVRAGRDVLGYIAQQRRLSGNSQAAHTLQELMGNRVNAYYHNADDGYWATIAGEPASPPRPTEHVGHVRRPGSGDLLADERPIAGTPLVVTMEIPRDAVLAAPRHTLRTLIFISLLLVLAGAAAGWVVGRRVARPLGAMTHAARALAEGNYGARVPAAGAKEVVSLAESFNNMAAQIAAERAAVEREAAMARAANQAKSEFLTTMSHELRTPLNAIGGYTELIELGIRGPVTDQQRHDLQRIRAAQAHLLSLISAVLDLSRIESGRTQYHLEPVSVEPFLGGLDHMVAPQAAAKSLTLEYEEADPTLVVIADPEKLRQVMLNLLSNAVRYVPAGGRITMRAEAHGSVAKLTVADDGPGIPEEKQASIFEPFVQLDRSLSQNQEGVGLGLAISRDLARGMGGDLVVESRPGEGSRFTVILPRVQEPSTRRLPTPSSTLFARR